MPGESQRKSIQRREIRRLIDQAKSENRSFEDLYLEMYPDDTSSTSTSDTDDCRPLDDLSIPSVNESEASQTLESVTQRDRLAAIALLKGRPPSSDVAEDEDSPYVQQLETKAQAFLEYHVKLESLVDWKADLITLRKDLMEADRRYDKYLAWKYLGEMWEDFYQAQHLERERRLKMFVAWKNRKIVISALKSWIIRHRENVVRKMAEDSQDIRAVTVALGKWRSKAVEWHQKKLQFRRVFFATKYGRKWIYVVQQRLIARTIAVLEQKYNAYLLERNAKLLRKFLVDWKGRAADTAAIEVKAADQHQQSQTVRTKTKAHEALNSMFMVTFDGASMEAVADKHHDKSLVLRALSSNSEWRVRTRNVQEWPEMADEFRTIRDEAKAQRGFRNMRKTAAWGKTMDNKADAHYHQTTDAIGRRVIRSWRIKAATKRGEVLVREPPATPAARMSALRQYQQSLR